MFQFPGFPTTTVVGLRQEVPLGNQGIKGSMCLPLAYRNLVRPSSALEPSHPPNGVVTAKTTGSTLTVEPAVVNAIRTVSSRGLNTSANLGTYTPTLSNRSSIGVLNDLSFQGMLQA